MKPLLKKTSIFLALVAILLSLPSTTYAADPLQQLGDTFKGVWDWIYNNILAPLGGLIQDYLIKPLVETTGNFFKTMINAMMYPFQVLNTAWNQALHDLERIIGPLAPLVLFLLIAAVLVIAWYILKWILPGI